MIILRIDDVGRAPNQPAWGEPDRNLEYFWRWREALGLQGLHVVYGVIPESVTDEDVQNLHDGLKGGEELAVHGWDHVDGAIVTREQMRRGADKLMGPCRIACQSYIPPFNRYDATTLGDWATVMPNGIFLGGQMDRDQFYGHLPVKIGGTWHIGAFPPLYKHAHELAKHLDIIERWGQTKVPVVLTLHTVWDINHLGEARAVVQACEPYLTSQHAIRDYRPTVDNKIQALTEVECVAIKYLRDHVQPMTLANNTEPNIVIDGMLEWLGCSVQRLTEPERCDYAVDFFRRNESFQHMHDRIVSLMATLKPGGTLFVFSKFAPHHQGGEGEAILSAQQHDDIAFAAGGRVVNDFTFRKANPERCPPEDADHIFYALKK